MNKEQRAKNREQRTENKEQRAMFETAHCPLLFVTCSLLLVLCSLLFACATWGATSAEEYYSIGMAYYDMGKYAEAEKWLNRAKTKDKTQSASEYILGRIAYENGNYDEALKHFDYILKRDPNNIMALKAAAYTRIRNGDIEKADALYERLLALVPESADDGYNHALVLFAMEKYAEAEQVLKNHEFALLDNYDVLLLYARAQKEQGKPEAIDSYAKWLANNSDVKVRYEYAQLLEGDELYARALEEYREAMEDITAGSTDPSKPDIHFAIARVLLIADSGNAEGITELKGAVEDGFSDTEKLEELAGNVRISASAKNEIRSIITEIKRAAEAAEAAESEAAAKAEAAKAAAAEVFVDQSETDIPETDDSGETN